MYGGISGPAMLRAAAKAGFLAFLGTAGLTLPEVDRQLRDLADDLGPDGILGANLLHRHGAPDEESALVDLFLRRGWTSWRPPGSP